MFDENEKSMSAKQAEKMRRDSTLFEIAHEKAVRGCIGWLARYFMIRHYRDRAIRSRGDTVLYLQGLLERCHAMVERKLDSAYAMARAMDGCQMAARIYEEEVDEYGWAVSEGGSHDNGH